MIRALNLLIRTILLLSVILHVTAHADSRTEVVPGVSLELAQHRAAMISDISYQLRFAIPAEQDERIGGLAKISFTLADSAGALQLDFRQDTDNLTSVTVNGAISGYRFENGHIVIPADELLAGRNLIEICFTAGDSSLNRNPEYLYTLFVPDRARTAFPLFDQPDLKATYELTLGVPLEWTAMSNAPIDTIVRNETNSEYHFRNSDLISSYLFSFVAGKFETITREVDGRSMTMLHRETDSEKVTRNIDRIFELHSAALDWLEEYTGIEYPYQKFGFALIPSFQYGGMEHVGAILYRASGLLLDEASSDTRLLGRAALIAHETAHMWFGNLVTMEWFNDVWTKEVFANFMAAKIVNPGFPDIDHDLNFLVRHYPGAYSVDRTTGANPIRQELPNLNEAGQMYGAIIYNKAPIVMRQLEMMIGEDQFREGMREYLRDFAFGNATWPDLVRILDTRSDEDVQAWSDVWVNSPGRPDIDAAPSAGGLELMQRDPGGLRRVWPQQFGVSAYSASGERQFAIVSVSGTVSFDDIQLSSAADLIFNADGRGYARFPAGLSVFRIWDQLNDVEKGSSLINLYENMLDAEISAKSYLVSPVEYFARLSDVVSSEPNELVLHLALEQLQRIYWTFLPVSARSGSAPDLERLLWRTMLRQSESSKRKIFFDSFADIAISPGEVQKVYDVWSGSLVIEDLPLSENDLIALSQTLAIKLPEEAEVIVVTQIGNTKNPDNIRKFKFIAPSLSAEQAVRDRFFYSLMEEENRAVESWVLDALRNLHHPLRVAASERYILPSLELLQEIQVTGDIFFPKRWLDVTLANYRSATAIRTIRTFLDARPHYNQQLRMKILQSADMSFRANRLVNEDQAL